MNPSYSYTDAGFDSFLSRSIDNLPQANLDSQGPQSTAIRYDSSQLTGAIGDSFNLGGIKLSGKDNAVTLNDGALNVNDSSTGTSMQASSGNITYYDSQGRLVVQEGNLPRGATGIRIVDANQIGIAQFGRNADGTTTLKIARDGFEVNQALDSQLVFNSAQNVFKIKTTGSTSFAVGSLTTGATATKVISHGLGVVPAIVAFVNGTGSSYLTTGRYYSITTVIPVSVGGVFEAGIQYWFEVDTSNIYFHVSNYTSLSPVTDIGTATFKYYILQETAI